VDQMLNVIGSVSTAVFFLMNASTVLDVVRFMLSILTFTAANTSWNYYNLTNHCKWVQKHINICRLSVWSCPTTQKLII